MNEFCGPLNRVDQASSADYKRYADYDGVRFHAVDPLAAVNDAGIRKSSSGSP